MLLAISPSAVWPWDIRGFSLALSTLLDSLISRAASDDSLRKLATGNVAAPDNDTIYALVQCTPDLDEHGYDAPLAYIKLRDIFQHVVVERMEGDF